MLKIKMLLLLFFTTGFTQVILNPDRSSHWGAAAPPPAGEWFYPMGIATYTNSQDYSSGYSWGDSIRVMIAGDIDSIACKLHVTSGTTKPINLGLYWNSSGTTWTLVECVQTEVANGFDGWLRVALVTPYAASANQYVRVYFSTDDNNETAVMYYSGTATHGFYNEGTSSTCHSTVSNVNADYDFGIGIYVVE